MKHMHNTYQTFAESYADMIDNLEHFPEYVSSPRGQKVREILGYSFTIQDPRARLANFPGRNVSLTYMMAELVWYLAGDDSTEWIARYAPFWNAISELGKANSAYGSRLFYDHRLTGQNGKSQWERLKTELRSDRDSRRAILHINTPHDMWNAKKDVPCTLTIQYFIRNNKLVSCVNMRSSDVMLGIPYDVFFFTFMQELLANELGIGLGAYHHNSGSLHLYERDENMLKDFSKGSVIGGLMKPIVGKPDVKLLLECEQAMSTTTDPIELMRVINERFSSLSVSGTWFDVLNALALHWMKKRGVSKEAIDRQQSMFVDPVFNMFGR